MLTWQNSFSYSHNNKEQNAAKTDFSYFAGDVIRVETKETGLVFVNEANNKQWTLKLSLTEDEWKQTRFFALLNGRNDAVSIM